MTLHRLIKPFHKQIYDMVGFNMHRFSYFKVSKLSFQKTRQSKYAPSLDLSSLILLPTSMHHHPESNADRENVKETQIKNGWNFQEVSFQGVNSRNMTRLPISPRNKEEGVKVGEGEINTRCCCCCCHSIIYRTSYILTCSSSFSLGSLRSIFMRKSLIHSISHADIGQWWDHQVSSLLKEFEFLTTRKSGIFCRRISKIVLEGLRLLYFTKTVKSSEQQAGIERKMKFWSSSSL